jgi:hypothetical protein
MSDIIESIRLGLASLPFNGLILNQYMSFIGKYPISKSLS